MTHTGRVVLASGMGLYLLGWLLGLNELIMLATACLAALIFALAWIRSRSSLDVHREIEPVRVPRGEVAMGLVTIANRGTRRSPALVGREAAGPRTVEIDLPSLDPGAKRLRTYRLPTEHRGIVQVGPLTVAREDPLGLMRSGREYGSVETLFVQPVPLPISPLPSSRLRDLEGPTSDTAPQGTITFHRLREYVVGDDLRHIHWRSSARTGQLMVRHLVDTSQPHTIVVLDTRANVFQTEDEFERAVDIAASIIVASTSHGFPLEFHTTDGQRLVADGNRGDSSRFLDTLAGIDTATSGDFATMAAQLLRHRGGSSLAVVAASLNDADAAAIARVQRRFHTTVLVLVAPQGSVPAVPGSVVIDGTDRNAFRESWQRQVAR